MKTIEEAHAAGARDGKAGLGPLAPKNGPPGSHAAKLHAAYMQSYRDELVARVGVADRRKNRRPKKRARKGAAPRARGKTVTTVVNSKTVRRTNRRTAFVVLYAQRPGRQALKYLGHGKFGAKGRPVLFKSRAFANLAAHVLRDTFPQVLRGYTLVAR